MIPLMISLAIDEEKGTVLVRIDLSKERDSAKMSANSIAFTETIILPSINRKDIIRNTHEKFFYSQKTSFTHLIFTDIKFIGKM